MTNRLALALLLLAPAWPLLCQPGSSADSLLLQSIRLLEKGEYTASRKAAREAFGAFSKKENRQLKGPLHLQLASCELEFGSFNIADSLLNIALPAFKKSDPAYARALSLQAYSFIQQARYAAADSLLNIAASMQEKALGRWHPDYATTMDWMGLSLFEQRKPAEAAPFYQEAKTIRARKPGKESLDYAISFDHLAEYFQENEKLDSALAACQNAQDIVGEHPYRNRLLNTLGRVFQQMGQTFKAEASFDASLRLQEQLGITSHPHYGKTLLNLGQLANDLGRQEEAKSYYRKAMAAQEKALGTRNPEWAIPANSLADLIAQEDSLVKAGILFDEVADIFKKYGQKDRYLLAKQNAATYLRGTEKHEQALSIYNQIIQSEEFEELSAYGKAYIYKNYAEAFWITGDTSLFSKGDSLIKMAEKIYLEKYSKKDLNYLDFASAMAEVSDLRGNDSLSASIYARNCRQITGMINDNYPMMNEPERLYFYNYYVAFYPNFAKSFAKRQAVGFPALTKSLLELQATAKGASFQLNLEDQLLQASENDTLLSRMSKEYTLIKKFLIKTMLEDGANAYSKSHLDSLENSANHLEREMSRRSSKIRQLFGQTKRNITYDTLRLSLKEGEAIVDFMKVKYFDPATQKGGGDYYCALVCKNSYESPTFVPLAAVEDVNGLLFQADPSSPGSYLNSIPVNRALYEIIWAPIEPFLAGTERVFLCPEASLFQLAFHALYADNLGGNLLGAKYDIRYRLSPGDILRQPLPPPKKTIALMGGARFDALSEEEEAVAFREIQDDSTRGSYRFPYLPGTLEEVLKIRELFKARKWGVELFTGTDASEQNFRDLCKADCPGIIHLATHGKYFKNKAAPKQEGPLSLEEKIYSAGDPLFRSLIALSGANVCWKDTLSNVDADGILTAAEISTIALNGVDLVVLSACETGKGDILAQEGVFGLQRAFRLAGARSLLVSLWQVPDQQTVELMTAFYKYFLNGEPAADALKKAQFDMSKKYGPYYWAAFVLVE
ncbi:MAG: CHAT domain-containing tetratricopeptide repeat protein [Saprospiraceae bacterium]